MRTIKLTIEYEGAAYLGWQRQPQGMTIQQALEEAIAGVTGAMPPVIGAGRTDAGVHARGQVAHFTTSSNLPLERLHAGINALLPKDIVVLSAADAPEGFHARFSAKSKRYEYTLWNDPLRPALARRLCWHCRRPLRLEPMRQGARCLLGTHDFAAFESAGAESRTTVRTVTLAEWTRREHRLTFAIEADAFLYNMVRAIVGTLVEVGLGKMPPGRVADIIAARRRDLAGPTAPARGLCLARVAYAHTPAAPGNPHCQNPGSAI